MSVLSGKSGNITISGTAVTELRNWKWKRTSKNHPYASNNTSGYKKRVVGVFDSNGSFEVLDNPAGNTPALEVGGSHTLVLKLDGSTTLKTVPVVIDDIDATVDLDEGAIESFAITFSGNGAWS